MDQRASRETVSLIRSAWNANLSQQERIEDELASVNDDIACVKAEISSLANDRRHVPRDEKQYYTDLIGEAKDRKKESIEHAKQLRSELVALQDEHRRIRSQAKSFHDFLRSELRKLERGVDRIRSAVPTSTLAHVAALGGVAVDGYNFMVEMLEALDGIGGTESGTVDQLEYVPIELPSSRSGTSVHDEQLYLIEPPRLETYLSLNEENIVPCEVLSVADTLGVPGPSKRDIELASVKYTTSYLDILGHSSILDIGGPGLPDMLSLSPDKRVCITEIKGTKKQTELHASGLKRTVMNKDADKGLKPEVLMENSPAWLLRSTNGHGSVIQTIKAIDTAIERAKQPSQRTELLYLREGYVKAASRGFNPLICDRQVVQVGFHAEGDGLKPPTAVRSQTFDEYLAVVQPSRVIQINVLEGSAAAPGFLDGPPAADQGRPGEH